MTVVRTERLREIRKKKGFSQRELARQCGFGEAQIFRYESGMTEPTAETLVEIAKKLEVSVDYLTGLSDRPTGQIGDSGLTSDEWRILDKFRQEGWRGLARLSFEKATEQSSS